MLLPPTSLELEQLLSALVTHLPTWAHIPTPQITVTTLNGLSNKVILASLETYNGTLDPTDEILPANTVIKLKNKKTVGHPMKAFAQIAEKTILGSGYGPKILYDDENFQITEYIRSRELTVEDYKVQGKRVQVAACIAKFNKIVPENGQSLTTENGQILTAENGQNSEILTAGNPEISLNSEPLLLYLLKDKKNYLETLERKLAADKFSVQEMESLQLPLSLISDSETKYLTEMFKSEPLGWDLRFSHNDLFYANVLLDFDREDLVLIDYEYSCMNPFMWDLGHMVNEATLSYSRTLYVWPYYKYDESLFPTDTQLGEILKAYWLFDTFDQTVLDSVKGSFGDEWFENLKGTKQWADVDPGLVADLLRKFKKIMVATNYYWMIWVMLDLRNPMFPQDTLHFIGQRAQMYLDWKKRIAGE